MKRLFTKLFSGTLLYKLALGAHQRYVEMEENPLSPGQYRHLGKNVRIEAGVAIAAPERLYLGDNVGLSQRVYINAVGGCHIGRGCQIGSETMILTTEHQYTGGESCPTTGCDW